MATESVSQQQPQEPVGENSTPKKPTDLLCSNKPMFHGSSPSSLNRLMYRRSALKAAHSAFVQNYEMNKTQQARKAVTFDYGYGYDEPLQQDRPAKRRRFQRRNSKTPAMLMAMSAAALDLDFLDKEEEEEQNKTTTVKPVAEEDDDDSWDGGLEIAEELVKQLQQRRKSNASSC